MCWYVGWHRWNLSWTEFFRGLNSVVGRIGSLLGPFGGLGLWLGPVLGLGLGPGLGLGLMVAGFGLGSFSMKARFLVSRDEIETNRFLCVLMFFCRPDPGCSLCFCIVCVFWKFFSWANL